MGRAYVERSCCKCKYNAERAGNNICTLRHEIVTEVAREHLDFPENFMILNNWFMGLKPCEYYEELT